MSFERADAYFNKSTEIVLFIPDEGLRNHVKDQAKGIFCIQGEDERESTPRIGHEARDQGKRNTVGKKDVELEFQRRFDPRSVKTDDIQSVVGVNRALARKDAEREGAAHPTTRPRRLRDAHPTIPTELLELGRSPR